MPIPPYRGSSRAHAARPPRARRGLRLLTAAGLAGVLLLAACTPEAADEAADAGDGSPNATIEMPDPAATTDAELNADDGSDGTGGGSDGGTSTPSASPSPTATPDSSPSPSPSPTTPSNRTPTTTPATGWDGSLDDGTGTGDSAGSDGSSNPGDADTGGDAGGDADDEQVDPELMEHSDEVVLHSDIGELGFAWQNTSYDVEPGASWSYEGADWSGSNLTINVEASHDDSSSVATWFNEQVNDVSIHSDVDNDTGPNELHYAFCGYLSFGDYSNTQVRTCFGQGDGDSDLTNNWWIGGTDYTIRDGELCYIDPSVATSLGTSLVACIDSEFGDSYHFDVDMGDADDNHVSLYSPSDIQPYNPQTLAGELEKKLQGDLNLSDAQKAVLNRMIGNLPDEDIQPPTSWTFTCGSDPCTDTANHAITDGQIWAGVHSTTEYSGVAWTTFLSDKKVNNYSLDATAGRDSSDAPATWFIDQVTSGAGKEGGGMIGAGVNSATEPGELHFAFCGTLESHGGTDSYSIPLCLGQGENFDDGDANNWWFGGAEWINLGEMSSQSLAQLSPSSGYLDGFGPLGDTDVRVLVNIESRIAIAVLSGNAVTGVGVDGFAMVIGIG